MATIRQILRNKDGGVHTVSASVSVLDATRLMNEHQIGALVVTDGTQVVGIFTERDVLRRVVARRRAPATTPVGEVMTSQVICASPDDEVRDVQGLMRNRRIRHVPIVDDDGNLIEMISIGDLNAHFANRNEITIRYLSEFIHGYS